jgi:hypothetical protein
MMVADSNDSRRRFPVPCERAPFAARMLAGCSSPERMRPHGLNVFKWEVRWPPDRASPALRAKAPDRAAVKS